MNEPDLPDLPEAEEHPDNQPDQPGDLERPHRVRRPSFIKAHFGPLKGPPDFLVVMEALLKEPGRVVFELSKGRGAPVTIASLLIAIICLAGYGFTVGVFSGGAQLWAAPAKIVVGALLTILICFPSLAIFSCLSGANARMREVFGALVCMVALYSVLLLGFGPVSWVFSQATQSVAFMGLIHIIFWAIGLYYGMRFLCGTFQFLDGRNSRHLGVWIVIFLVVSLQMTTYLRPIVGSSEALFTQEKKFFLAHWAETVIPPRSEQGEAAGD
jgi:hypothetical protein